MINDFMARLRPENRPEPQPEADPTPGTPGAAVEATAPHPDLGPDRTAPLDAVVAAPTARVPDEPRAFGHTPEASVRPEPAPAAPVTPVETVEAAPPPPAADRAALEAASAEAEAEAREDTHPDADVRGFDLGTADWRYSRADTRRRLPREETDTLICAGKVEGTHVFDQEGKRMGRVETVMLNKTSGRIEYAVVRLPGGLVSGETYRPVPWAELRYDTGVGGYQLDRDRQALKRDRAFEEGR